MAQPRKRKFETEDANYGPTTEKVMRGQYLTVNLNQLEATRSFPRFMPPTQLATFSTILKEDTSNPAHGSPQPKEGADSKANISKYTIASTYKRTLSSDSKENLMIVLDIPSDGKSVCFDLNKGYGTQIPKENDYEFMSLLLECLVSAKLIGKHDFVCWRGLLTKISATPYDANGRFDDGMKISVQKIGTTWYMYEFPTEQAKRKQGEQTDQQKRMTYWGMKFESYLTAKPECTPNVDDPLNFNHEFGCVVSSKLGKHSLIFGGEVDCCFPNDKTQYVELKTTRQMDHPRQEYSFRRYKLMKWWLQSFLIGIDSILCGYRDDNGIVKRCDWFKIADIPNVIKQDRNTWRPVACLAFLEQFLDFVRENVKKEYLPHVLTRLPGDNRFTMEQDETGEYNFIPDWLTKHVSVSDSQKQPSDNAKTEQA